MRRITQEQWQDWSSSAPRAKPETWIGPSDFADQTPRTLAYGYTVPRNTWHLYLHDGDLHLLVYSGPAVIEHHQGPMPVSKAMPSKRLYPQHCDVEYLRLMDHLGERPPYTNWVQPGDRANRPFVGRIFEGD